MRTTTTQADARTSRGTLERNKRFEYRVWGKHRDARKTLRKLADTETREEIEDCYLLVDDPALNAKVRNSKIKVKRLLKEKKGFEQWTSATHASIDVVVTADDRDGIEQAIDALGIDAEVRPVFVTKRRRRYRIGDIRAEVTDIEIHERDDTVRTISIQGDDLRELVRLRKKLGLKGEPNTSVNRYLEIDLANE